MVFSNENEREKTMAFVGDRHIASQSSSITEQTTESMFHVNYLKKSTLILNIAPLAHMVGKDTNFFTQSELKHEKFPHEYPISVY